jgi:hypothetical protein
MAFQLRAGKEIINVPRVCDLVIEMVSAWNKQGARQRIEWQVCQEADKDVPSRLENYAKWRGWKEGIELTRNFDALDFVLARRFVRYAAENKIHVTRIN